jgi:hypothetical protein
MVNYSVQAHTREERNRSTIVVNKPLIVLLENILTRATVLSQDSIQARLCGGSLMPTIEQFDPGFTNPSDQIAEQEHICRVGVRNHLGVIKLEINALGDSVVHQAFDLAHGLNPFDSFNIQGIRAPVNSFEISVAYQSDKLI